MNMIAVDELVRAALVEDCPYLDVTTEHMIEESATATGVLAAKADGVLCGLEPALRAFTLLDDTVSIERLRADGDRVQRGDVLARVSGWTRTLLKGERVALNLLQHLSGIATATAALVEQVASTRAVISDTRKTLPGLRMLQKYAVCCGGGRNHRFNLCDAAMLKDNHIDAGGGIGPAVARLRGRLGHTVKIEVETRTLDEVRQALAAGADIIMLDNMSPDLMRQAVALIGGRVPAEASGGIDADTIRAVAEAGVDIISVGALTHSVTALDIHMRIEI